VIPGRVTLDLELRSIDDALLASAEDELCGFALAAKGDMCRLSATPPQRFSTAIIECLERVSDRLGLSHRGMWSGAGHDAGLLASVTDAAMIFVPSRGGVSHSVDEFTDYEHCVTGAEVLLNAIVEIDARG
jgi:beta-ureidopropionase / N-carbamoyl-L-amino-acid hydrolase